MTFDEAIAIAAQHGLHVGYKRVCHDGRVYEVKRIYIYDGKPYLVVFDDTLQNRIYTIEDFDPSRALWEGGYTDNN